MARQFSMPYMIPPVCLLAPAADSAGRTSPYRDMRNALKAWIVVHVNQGSATPPLLSVLQGQGVAGTNPIAVGAMPIFLCAATATSDALVQQTSAATFTPSATEADKIVVFEITPEMCMTLSSTAGAVPYSAIAVSTGASSASNITEATLYILQSIQGASAPSTYV
jgi:hypothetical protein